LEHCCCQRFGLSNEQETPLAWSWLFWSTAAQAASVSGLVEPNINLQAVQLPKSTGIVCILEAINRTRLHDAS
jgi:hypothetical protein